MSGTDIDPDGGYPLRPGDIRRIVARMEEVAIKPDEDGMIEITLPAGRTLSGMDEFVSSRLKKLA